MQLRTFCSIAIIPTLILILLLLSSVDNYLPETQIYGQLTYNNDVAELFNIYSPVNEITHSPT